MNDTDVFALLDKEVVDTTTSETTYALTSKKDYHQLKRYSNVTSYSMLLELHACPRKLQLARHNTDSNQLDNIDFAFGHAVGAGVQSLFKTGNLQDALYNSFLAWNIPFDARIAKSKKSIWEAAIAVEKFLPVIVESLEEWELVWVGIRDTLKAGIELSFSLDTNNGYRHYGHIDVVLKNKVSGEVAVIELKTTGLKYAEEAVYANSSQATGYSVILDTLFPGLSSYEVFHFIYSSSDREWTAMPFTKTVTHKSEWIKDLLLDHAMLDKYEELGFYPKRGESCYNYFRRCEYFGSCNLVPDASLPKLGVEQEAEIVDFQLNLVDVIKAQQGRIV